MLYTDRYPEPTRQMSTEALLREATRLEQTGTEELDHLDLERYRFVRRELDRRDANA